ncbi:MAG TPA: AMP-binding protein [Candidatus Acidoferrales bacterium]|nr:AMP-binding protein [Candidatus Acidoferrales bacterium]
MQRTSATPVVGEVRDGQIVSVNGGELLGLIEKARAFILACGLRAGDRCALYGPNSIRWIAADLALMAQGVVVVPLDPRQVAGEIAAVVRDASPALIFCSDEGFAANLPSAPETIFFDKIFAGPDAAPSPPLPRKDDEHVTIVYTSGTSGEQKGAIVTVGNITFMLGCTNARLDILMGQRAEPDRVFQYAPFCFGAARILLLTSLSRNSMLVLSTDLTKLSDELKLSQPNYFVNVPLFLERVRRRVEESIAKRGGFAAKVFNGAQRAYLGGGFMDKVYLAIAKALIFPSIRRSVGPNVKALICGSAPLALETQKFFMMLGIAVLQVYGLTETTAICTMDDPRHVEPGRVGSAIPGVEIKVADDGEILVRGPNVFAGYWQRPEATAKALAGGWFHTGDQGEADANGNWRITGRLKNLLILNSGHNVAPEPLEEKLASLLPEAQQVMLTGNQRSFLGVLITIPGANGTQRERVQAVLDALNADLPYYKQIRGFQVLGEAFTAENGLLTTMGKLKRDAIAARYADKIEKVYAKRSA